MEDLTTHGEFPEFYNFTVNTTLIKIVIPSSCKILKIGSKDKDLIICRSGGVEGQAPPNNQGFIPKKNYLPINFGRGRNRKNEIFVCSQSGSANVSLILTEE